MTEETDVVLDLDLDAQEGQLREAAGKPVVIGFRGKTLEIPPPGAWGTDAMRELNEGNLDGWFRLTIGDELADKLEEKEPVRVYHLEEIFKVVSAKNGMDPKKSGASSKRSKTTRRK